MVEKDKGKNDGEGDEKKRLAPYGIGWNQVLPGGLSVPPRKRLVLSTDRAQCKDTGYVYLEPKTMDDVKRWIGVPDEVAAKRVCPPPCPTMGSFVEGSSELRNLTTEQVRALHEVGRTFVYGDSRRVAAHRDTLSALLVDAIIIGVFVRKDIDIYPSAELVIGADVKVLWARHIRIWNGGALRVMGDAKVDCVSITGGVKLTIPRNIDQYVTQLGLLTNLEV